jgi:type II secretory pathway pseudopilin PulG
MRNDERGFSLMEALVATVITVIAVIGLAHTFGMGRGFIDRFEVARSALAAAESRMEFLSALRSWSPELMIGDHPAIPNPFVFGNPARTIGTETWRVEWFDDPVTPGTIQDLKRVTVVVRWTMAATADSVTFTRLFGL